MPVAIDVSAVDVVDGATVRIGPPSIAQSVGARFARDSSCSQPKPSSTSSTTWSAAAAAGSQSGIASGGSSNAGTTFVMHGPP